VTETPKGLLLGVQRGLESLYALEPEPPVTDFLIPGEEASSYPGGGSRTLVTQEGDEVALGVVLEPSVVESLEKWDPRDRLFSSNLAPFLTAAEEVSHFLYLLYCARWARSTTKLELELQGEVDKYLASVFLLSLQNDGAVSKHLREVLFRHYHLSEGLTAEETERYRAASDLAYRYCSFLEVTFLRPSRLSDLASETRRFYRLSQREKLERIAGLPGRLHG
jgi:hypothetical protein